MLETKGLACRGEMEEMTLQPCLSQRTNTRGRALERVQALFSERSLLISHANLTSFGPAIGGYLAHHEDIVPLD